MLMGTSPTPGIVSWTNCPGLKAQFSAISGSSNLKRNSFSLSVSG